MSSKLENVLGMGKGVYLLLKGEVHLMLVEVLMPLQWDLAKTAGEEYSYL